MDDRIGLTERFEQHRPRLRAVAYRMLGSFSEADDAVQEAWLRLSHADTRDIENLGGWLTTVVSRICLNMLRSSRREESLEMHLPDPLVSPQDGGDPEQQAMVADAVGFALMVVLQTLSPAERLAFVLHDTFAIPFEEIAPMLERSPAAARQLASRARRRIRTEAPTPDRNLRRQREVVDAFFAAARHADFDALVSVLDPDVVLRADGGATRGSTVLQGARTVSAQALTYARLAPFVRPALVNGAAGVVIATDKRVLSIMGFTVAGEKIVAIDVLMDPGRVSDLDLNALNTS